MSKYRVEFKPSRLILIFQWLTYFFLVFSIFSWQQKIVQYQMFLQLVIVSIFTLFVFRSIWGNRHKTLVPVLFSVTGEWLEVNKGIQSSWKITKRSRISFVLLFIHLVSSTNSRDNKWCLVCKDQISERDFSRLSRAVLFQQQISDKN